MRLAFKNWGFGFSEKEVEITLNIGTLEAVCKDLDIEFYEIGDKAKVSPDDFRTELLYQGYITACKDRYSKPKFDKVKAIIWNEYLSQSALKEFNDKVNFLMGEISRTTIKKKVKSRSR